jgi:hypothetical protein
VLRTEFRVVLRTDLQHKIYDSPLLASAAPALSRGSIVAVNHQRDRQIQLVRASIARVSALDRLDLDLLAVRAAWLAAAQYLPSFDAAH